MASWRRLGPMLLLLIALFACGGGGGGGGQQVPGPTSLLVIDMGDRQTLDLSWMRPSQGADTYQVEHSINGGAFSLLKTVDGGSADTLIATSGYPDAAKLAFRVRGIAGGSATAYSNTATFQFWVRAPSQVQTTTYLNADGTFANKIGLSWTRNAFASTGVRIDRVLAPGGTSTLATLPPGTTQWSDTAPVEGVSTAYTVTNLAGSVASDAGWSNSLVVPVISPVIASVTQSGTSYTLTWTKAGVQADQFAVGWKTGLDGTYLDSYGTGATVSGTTLTATLTGLPAGYLSFRVKALKNGQAGSSAPWGFVPPPTVPGTAFAATPLSFPSASYFALSSTGRCLALDPLLSPPLAYEVQDGGYRWQNLLQSNDKLAAAGTFDSAQEPHFLVWRPTPGVTGQWDLLRFRRQGTTWSSGPTGLTSTSATTGVALMDAGNHLHFVVRSGTTFLHASDASGSWTGEDTGLSATTGGPWAASLDGSGQPRIFLGVNAAGGTSAGWLALRSQAGAWSQEAIPVPFQVDRATTGDLVALPGGRLGLATVLYNHATYAAECWWFERGADGSWSSGQKLGVYGSVWSGSVFLLAGAPDASRTALLLNDALFLRDTSGTWTSGTFCPIGYQTGPLAMAFTAQGKLMVLAKGGNAGYYFPQPYLLYQEQ